MLCKLSQGWIMIYILDNYDSFTYNLVQAMTALGETVHINRNDQVTSADILSLDPAGVVFSPGPGRPENAGRMPGIFRDLAGKLPILGVCLGHQMIALRYGGRIVPAVKLIHGKASRVQHDGKGVFRRLPSPLICGRYHSLAVERWSVPDCLEVSAWTDEGEIMGLRHRELPIEGVQFHPESILTPHGSQLLKNFLSAISKVKTRIAVDES